ncbi:uncharacterized protein LOC128222373 [Mya arenaria]|uniref:uncharacterized protein LOC128222373 n=1 Tax=Mya arenaria TaxID=6604 RepID=UPI0022E7BB90|nr:uncharacterized protein LOC128222373 [Mya arenaria]
MSNPNSTSTLISKSAASKRDLSSPMDDADTKKYKLSESNTTVHIEDTSGIAPCALSKEDLFYVSKQISATFHDDMSTLVETLISKLVPPLVKSIHADLTSRINALEYENAELKSKVFKLENEADRAEQYSRRNCLRVAVVAETTSENTDDIVLGISNAVSSGLLIEEIDRSHRVGPVRNDKKPRDIIVKFVSYRSRQKLYQRRSALKKSSELSYVYVNEDLTRKRSSLLYEARRHAKTGSLSGAWSSDGNVLIKDKAGKIHAINCPDELYAALPAMLLNAKIGQPTIMEVLFYMSRKIYFIRGDLI